MNPPAGGGLAADWRPGSAAASETVCCSEQLERKEHVKRDLDLVRTILLTVETSDTDGLERDGLRLEGYDDQVVARHVQLLDEAGYVIASYTEPDQGGVVLHKIGRLTWKGHEFLDAARNDNIWYRVKDGLRTKAASVPFEALTSLLVEATKKWLGT